MRGETKETQKWAKMPIMLLFLIVCKSFIYKQKEKFFN